MRHQPLTLWQLFPIIVGSGFFVLSSQLLWGQRPPPHTEIPVFHRVVQLSRVLDAESPLHDSPESLLPSSDVIQGPAESHLSYFPFRNDHYPTVFENKFAAKLYLPVTVDLRSPTEYVVARTPNKPLRFEPNFGKKKYRAISRSDELEIYARHIPWAGSIIMGISRQEKSHPRVARALKFLKLRF